MPEHEDRSKVFAYLRRVLYGPLEGEAERVTGTPFLRYMTGILFPIGEGVQEGEAEVTATAEESVREAEGGDALEGGLEPGMELAFETLPSAVGLSFRIRDDARVSCQVSAARYSRVEEAAQGNKKGRATRLWARTKVPAQGVEVHAVDKRSKPKSVLSGLARLVVRWRSAGDGTAIVTISMVNDQKASGRGLDPSKALFQVHMRCEAPPGAILAYPEVASVHQPGSEDAEVAYLYRKATPFARGHGCAATWEAEDGQCKSVATEFIPSVDVPYATFELDDAEVDEKCFDLAFLDSAPRTRVLAAFSSLRERYAAWVETHKKALKPHDQIGGEFVSRAARWVARIEKGIELLRKDDIAWSCFKLANHAMGMQMALADNVRKGPYAIDARRKMPRVELAGRRWRPFQIAFFLAEIDSLMDEGSKDRELVDVIWFPTGGGKTEAYLFITAFELVRRRYVHKGKDTATAILSRYTLRLLTAQQFQRTAALMVALELLRQSRKDELGERPFTLGLWVGSRLTPNSFRQAHELFNQQLESRQPRNLFLLEACPCCGTEIFPRKPVRAGQKWRDREFGVVSTQAAFYFRCPNVDCEFHERLPLNIVDEALYAEPPSMLLGTIDKFALLPWDDRARVFFGGPDDKSYPTSLVIQDELHLISGPLGSLAAPYEAAIDTVIRLRGHRPKRIGSTATIRNAKEQVRGLYGREATVFPSPCGFWDSAFFFGTDSSRPGRLYVGVMGQGYIKPVVAMAWTAAALLQAPKEVALSPKALDSYWTLLAYHNSRRELGRTLTAARDEVATRIQAIASHPTKARKVGEPLELSAQMVKSMSEALGELQRNHAQDRPAVDFVPCTSIISVGVDVDRLGMMLVNGQPKLTSEYIQATSRVGRGEVPGLVVTLFSPSKPRDRSHYEDFRAYHEAIYRHVEPTSVTPYAIPARERTLHAALVTLIRHALPWKGYDKAGQVDFDSAAAKEALESLLSTMKASDPSEAKAVAEHVKERINEWREFAEANKPLLFEHRHAGMQFAALLYEYGKVGAGALWPTMMSVRNVDAESPVAIQ